MVTRLRDILCPTDANSARVISLGLASYRPLWHHTAGRNQTASGYGSRLVSSMVIRLIGERRQRRIYITQWSNSGMAWIVYRGQRCVIRDSDITTEAR
jgi:hypothetical protein